MGKPLSVIASTLIACAVSGHLGLSTGQDSSFPLDDVAPSVALTRAPVGAESHDVEWVTISASRSRMLAAVARPQRSGSFPTVVILHGSHGFAQEYVRLAASLAKNGVIAVAPCWFSGGGGAGSRFITPIACVEALPITAASGNAAVQTVSALVKAALGLAGVQPGHIAVFGHSRGAGAALNYALAGGAAQAIILDSGVYPDEMTKRAPEIKMPVLMLHGTLDTPSDGGAASTDVHMARQFESAMRRAGRQVEVAYYEGGRHNGIFSDAAQYQDEVSRITAFIRGHLGN